MILKRTETIFRTKNGYVCWCYINSVAFLGKQILLWVAQYLPEMFTFFFRGGALLSCHSSLFLYRYSRHAWCLAGHRGM
jgi:hypothetical protein